jgi:hypothetical protein
VQIRCRKRGRRPLGAFAVAHVHARTQEHPVAVFGSRDEPTVGVVAGRVRSAEAGARAPVQSRSAAIGAARPASRLGEKRILMLLGDVHRCIAGSRKLSCDTV